jgi:hypothetical protein
MRTRFDLCCPGSDFSFRSTPPAQDFFPGNLSRFRSGSPLLNIVEKQAGH